MLQVIIFLLLSLTSVYAGYPECIVDQTSGHPASAKLLSPLEARQVIGAGTVLNGISGSDYGPEGLILMASGTYYYNGDFESTAYCGKYGYNCVLKDINTAGCVGCKNAAATNYDDTVTWHDESVCTFLPAELSSLTCSNVQTLYESKSCCNYRNL